LTRPDEGGPPGPATVRGKRNLVGRQITISSQIGQQAPRRPFPVSPVSNIDTIRTTLTFRDGLVDDEAIEDPTDVLDGLVQDYPDDDVQDDGADYEDGYGELGWPEDRRLRPVAAIIGAVVAIGAIATAVIINSGDSASTKATLGAPVTSVTSDPPPSSTAKLTAPPSPSASVPSAPRTTQLPPETVTTVTPTLMPSTAPTLTPTLMPGAPLPTALPPTAALNPRTVLYTVAGTKQLFDLVNIVYTDARGYPQTEFNVALPWSKAIVLNPGVQTVSVVATSIYSHLNCSVVNAEGQPIVMSTNNGMIATCTR
jgi:hypothetical protein